MAGVPQGDPLVPFLFVIVLDSELRDALAGPEQGLGLALTPQEGPEALTDLDMWSQKPEDLEQRGVAVHQENQGDHF